jgi:hypothetical protein
MKLDMIESFDGKTYTAIINPSARKDIEENFNDFVSILNVVDLDNQVASLTANVLRQDAPPSEDPSTIFF